MSFETPSSLKIKRGTVIPLEKGWKKETLYLVDVAFSFDNVIHERLFYSGLLASGIPAGYSGFAVFGCSDAECFELHDAYYIKVIREINISRKEEGNGIYTRDAKREKRMISERTLKRWRKEALKVDPSSLSIYNGTAEGLAKRFLKCQGCILCMTQELLDLHLIKEEKDGKQ